jgi:hypothetical protein
MVFRALVIGLETQHRIDPDSLGTAEVASALAMVTGAAPFPTASSPPPLSLSSPVTPITRR